MSVPIFDSTKPVYGTRQYVVSSIRSLAAKGGLSLKVNGTETTIDVMCSTVGCAYEIRLVLGRNERWRKTYDNPYHQHAISTDKSCLRSPVDALTTAKFDFVASSKGPPKTSVSPSPSRMTLISDLLPTVSSSASPSMSSTLGLEGVDHHQLLTSTTPDLSRYLSDIALKALGIAEKSRHEILTTYVFDSITSETIHQLPLLGPRWTTRCFLTTQSADSMKLLGFPDLKPRSRATVDYQISKEGVLKTQAVSEWLKKLSPSMRVGQVITGQIVNTAMPVVFAKFPFQVNLPPIVDEMSWKLDDPKKRDNPLRVIMTLPKTHTDWHYDWNGVTTVISVHQGIKVFALAPPTEANLSAYRTWVQAGETPSLNKNLHGIYLTVIGPGQTLWVPGGTLHAVYSPDRSLMTSVSFVTDIDAPFHCKVSCEETTMRGYNPGNLLPDYLRIVELKCEKAIARLSQTPRREMTPVEQDLIDALVNQLLFWISYPPEITNSLPAKALYSRLAQALAPG